ncbi:WhiB family transcriptional regulator [Kibdelosporangium phytohabitans]|uniref:Transcription factor WhiB n=1 Tax=Kibdelosporangium phytohabitans TaxID=860235 RepID=A0A0N9I747_9PSEU|nr:WhiB family transcriptional regulator [Kibdelosporangium phytohabitans]ALG10322.1 transcription factor WhiB [Kibdelosporangium phytohabitans]MBE1461359.1 WhiB family redox-sensing transcriptional regulator [Kibdelosporangium phytohabitans]
MTTDHRLIGIAWRLDRLRWVPREVLADVVLRDGLCMWDWAEPAWMDERLSDRELAARMCSGCPVQDECLELELRTAGAGTVGVWGGLSDDDRRALYLRWLERGDRADDEVTP